ncbi:MAG: hypothetical protein LBK99_01135, partial [Opitutaceae bacterium]|nr:hypothetical protein [Opitutaceae bacterium]
MYPFFSHITRVPVPLIALPLAAAAAVAAAAPLLSPENEKDLLAAIELTPAAVARYPGLAPVRDAVSGKNYATARAALAAHLRNRNQPPHNLKTWRFTPRADPTLPPPPAEAAASHYPKTIADAALEGRVFGGMVELEATFPGNRIDWKHDETRARAARGIPTAYNPEWQWQLNRMAFWNDLAAAYRATADERYARA